MPGLRKYSGLVVAIILLVAVCIQAGAGTRVNVGDDERLQEAWQTYLQKDFAAQPAYGFPYSHCFRRAALEQKLPLTLLLAVARGESDFVVDARSHANAHGLMQIQWPGTAQHLGMRRLSELYVPCKNVDAGARYLRELLDRYDGNLHLALAAYNYGPARIAGKGADIPDGAVWYSGYIYRHLGYVLGGKRRTEGPRRSYASEQKAVLVEFAAPYRAEAFVKSMEAIAPDVRLDWFRVESGRFHVVMLYGSDGERADAEQTLAMAGFEPQKSRATGR